MKKRIEFLLNENDLKKLDEVAAGSGVARSFLIRKALLLYMADRRRAGVPVPFWMGGGRE